MLGASDPQVLAGTLLMADRRTHSQDELHTYEYDATACGGPVDTASAPGLKP